MSGGAGSAGAAQLRLDPGKSLGGDEVRVRGDRPVGQILESFAAFGLFDECAAHNLAIRVDGSGFRPIGQPISTTVRPRTLPSRMSRPASMTRLSGIVVVMAARRPRSRSAAS